MADNRKTELFESMPVAKALTIMAIPTIMSQLITLIYNIADTWFIGRAGNPYMVGASSLVLTVYLISGAISSLFGVGGGTLTVRLLGSKNEAEARKVASWTLAVACFTALGFSLLCLIFMDPLLRLLGASDNTIGYARQYLFSVIVIGAVFHVGAQVMSYLIRNAGYSREAGFGLAMGGILNIGLDPLFMFVLLPDGYQVMGAGIATMLSNVATFVYFLFVYRKIRSVTILEIPKRIEPITKESKKSLFSVGIPAALGLFLYDLCNIVINRLSASHGDIPLAAIGIVLKVERLPLNVGIGIGLGMIPLIAYNYASGNRKRMKEVFNAARIAGLAVAAVSVVLYLLFTPQIVAAFINDAETVRLGTEYLRAHALATPFMFLNFNMLHFMQAVNRGKASFALSVSRQLGLNIPLLFLLNALFGMTGVAWTQLTADVLNVIISYIVYWRVMRTLFPKDDAPLPPPSVEEPLPD